MVIPIITEVTSLAAMSRKLGSISNDQSEISELFQNNDNDSSIVMNVMSSDNWTLNEPQCSDTSVLPQLIHSETTFPRLWSSGKGKPGRSFQDNLCTVSSKTTPTPVAPSSSTNNTVNNNSVIPINTSKGAAAVLPNSVSSSVPNVSSCIQTWQRVFSWMVYRESDHSFTCRICDWGAVQLTSEVVFALTDPTEVYLVAGNLRSHQETRSHKMMAFKTSLIITFFKTIYPTLKKNLYKGLDDIISSVVNLCGGIFPGPRVSPQKEYFTSYMIKHIAECLEINLIESLTNSPFFSIIAVEGKDFAILRWLNQKGEPVEHFLCSKIFCSVEGMTITSYLQKKKVDTTKMILFRLFPSSTERPSPFITVSQLPVRYPPLSQLMNWLQKMDLFKDTFTHLEALTRLCKSSHPRLNNFPETAEIAQFEEPFSHACLLNKRVIKFFMGNVGKLKAICNDIYIKTGCLDALSISKLELRKSESLQNCVSLLLKLQEVFSKECSYFHLFELIKDFRCSVCKKLKSVKNCDPDEYAVLSLLDVYLSHVIISLLTPEQKFANIFIRKLSRINVNDIEQILKHLNIQFTEGAMQCFMSLQELHTRLSKHRDCNIIELLNNFSIDPKLCKDFPQLFHLYQKIKVVPFLRACTEQYMFNLAVLEMLSTDTVEKRLLPSLSLIALEGPPMEDINLDLVLDLWSKKWKMFIERK
ncbi:uncharacterized protein [Cherax quadricarinatus]|uniref:uncharacterized protein n=1 Tax=Cherax quadricarinatus TaxID=27406 RepID=UPI00387ED704